MNAKPVSKEAIRILVADIGYQETARRTGIEYATLRQWSKRGNWNVTRQHAQAVTSVTRSPADAHADALRELEEQTRMSLAKSAARMSQEATGATLKQSGDVKNVAKTAAIVHRWDAKEQQSANVVVNVALLGIDPSTVSAQTIDVESGVSE